MTQKEKEMKIFDEITKERKHQDIQWGGPKHDDQHLPRDFFKFIRWQSYKFDRAAENDPDNHSWILYRGRARLIKIAALAIAGIESIDRKTQ